MANIFASTTGDDENSGAELSPKTFKGALAVAVAGDVIRVLPGTHVDTTNTDPETDWFAAFNPANNGESGSPITIISHVAREAILIGNGVGLPALSIHQRRYITVDGFYVDGQIKLRGELEGEVNGATGHHNIIQNCEVVHGDQEGTDTSLNWGICVHSSNDCIVRNNKVSGMVDRGNQSTNTAAIMYFGQSWRCIFENNDADGTNVHSAFGQKGGNMYESIWRYNIARNARSGDGGESGCGYLGKGNSGGDTFCDDHEYYGNIAINCRDMFFFNHNARRWQVYNNTAYLCDEFLHQWQLNSIDNDYWNNIIFGGRGYQIEALTGATPNWEPYIEYSDYNVFRSLTTVARWGSGSHANLAAWSGQSGLDTHSITTDPLFVDAAGGDFHLQGGSPARSVGRFGDHMGAYRVGDETIGVDWEDEEEEGTPVTPVRRFRQKMILLG